MIRARQTCFCGLLRSAGRLQRRWHRRSHAGDDVRDSQCGSADRSNLRIAEELGVREQQVAATISLLDGGATVPFVARYRKEATGALDDAQLRTLEDG